MDAVASSEPVREVTIQNTALDEMCRMGDYLNSITGTRERDADLTGMMQLRRELEDMVEEVRLENRLANEENKEIMKNGLKTLGEQIHKERMYFETDRAERLSATKRLREELDALAEEQIKGRRTLEAGLQSVEARILEAITSSRGVPVEPVCTPPRVCESQDRMRPHPTQRPDGLQAVESDSPQPTRLRRNISIDRPSSSSTRLSADPVSRRVTLISPDRVVDRSTPPQCEPVGRVPPTVVDPRVYGASMAYTRHLEKMLDLMEASQRTNERLMTELDNTRNNRTSRADNAVSKFKPEKYSGTEDGNIDPWLRMMKIHLDRQDEMTEDEKTFLVTSYLTKEARAFILNKPATDYHNVDSLFDLLSRRFGTGASRAQSRSAFASRRQQYKESINQFLDELEGLRIRAYPQEDRVTRDYEIMQRFINGVSDPELTNMLSTKYNDESYVTTPPTVEQLRYVANEYVRLRNLSKYLPRGNIVRPAVTTAANPVVPVTTEVTQSSVAAPTSSSSNPMQRARAEGGLCFFCGESGHYIRDCSKQKELVKAMTLGHAEAIQEISEGHDRSDSEEPERDGTGPESACSINRVASVNLKEKVTIIDDGASFKEVPIAFGRYEGRQPLDPISSMTVVRQDLFDDYCTNGIRKPAKLTPRDNLNFQGRAYQLSEPEEISLSIDGVEILTKACVVMDQNFPRPLVIGKNDLVAQGWKGPWDKPGTIGLTVDSTVLVPFASADGSLMLKGLMDTGAGPSIMGISAWKRLNLGVELDKKPCSLVAVNKNPITTYGLASSVRIYDCGD